MATACWVAGTTLMGMPKSAPKSGWMLAAPTRVFSRCVHVASTGAPETSLFQSSSAEKTGQPARVPGGPPTPARPPFPAAPDEPAAPVAVLEEVPQPPAPS